MLLCNNKSFQFFPDNMQIRNMFLMKTSVYQYIYYSELYIDVYKSKYVRYSPGWGKLKLRLQFN